MILLWFKRKRLVKEVEILADQVGWAAVDLSLASRQSSAQTYNYPWVRRKKKNEPVAEKIASL